MRSKTLLAAALLFVAGCAQIEFVPGVVQEARRTTQEITLSSGEHTETFIGVVEMYADRTVLAVVAANGLFLFSVQESVAGRAVERHQDLPEFVDPEAILTDVQLVNWPVASLQTRFGAKVQFNNVAPHRALMRRGQTVKTVQYLDLGKTESWSKATLIDARFGYRIDVRKVSEERIQQ